MDEAHITKSAETNNFQCHLSANRVTLITGWDKRRDAASTLVQSLWSSLMLIGFRKTKPLGTFSIVFFVTMLAVQEYYGRLLFKPDVPWGIVSLELASDVASTSDIFKSWGPELKSRAIKSLFWDYGFLISYGLLSFLASRWAGLKIDQAWNWPVAARVGQVVAILAILAALLDAVENTALLWQLFEGPHTIPARLAWICATTKFAILGAVLLFVAGGVLATARPSESERKNRPTNS